MQYIVCWKSISLLFWYFYYSFKYLYLNGIYMKEAQNQIRYHRFFDSFDKKNNAKDVTKSDEQMKKKWIQGQSKSNLIIKINELQVVFTLLSMGLLLSFTVFFIENTVFTKKIIKLSHKWTQIDFYFTRLFYWII